MLDYFFSTEEDKSVALVSEEESPAIGEHDNGMTTPEHPMPFDPSKYKLYEQALKKLQAENFTTQGLDKQEFIHLIDYMIGNMPEVSHDVAEIPPAAKLIIAFGTHKAAKAYLDRFQKAHPNSREPFHDACLFNLPSANEWDLPYWRQLIKQANPLDAHHLVFKLFPFADKLQNKLQNDPQALHQFISQKVSEEYKTRYAEEYDRYGATDRKTFLEHTIETEWQNKEAHIKKLVTFRAQVAMGFREAFSKEEKTEFFQNLQKKQDALEAQKDALRTEIEQEVLDGITQKSTTKVNQAYDGFEACKTKEVYVQGRMKQNQIEIARTTQIRIKQVTSQKPNLMELRDFLATFSYARAQENLHTAHLFQAEFVTEKFFNQYLDLKPVDDPKQIPPMAITGESIHPDYAGFTIEKLSPFDPEAAILGIRTSCCQSLNNKGDAAAIHGITEKNGGFYVIRNHNGKVVSQTWAWRSQNNQLVFDSIESQTDFARNHEEMVGDLFQSLAQQLVDEEHTEMVLVGADGQTPNSLQPFKAYEPEKPFETNGYQGDSDHQKIIAARNCPPLHQRLTSDKVMAGKTLTPLTVPQMKAWVALCVFQLPSPRHDSMAPQIDFLAPYLEGSELTLEDVHNYCDTVLEWASLNFMGNIPDSAVIQELLKRPHFNPDDLPAQIPRMAPWMKPVIFGEWEVVKFLHEQGVDIHKPDYTGNSTLIEAIFQGNVEQVKWLLDAGADLRQPFPKGKQPLITLIKRLVDKEKEPEIYEAQVAIYHLLVKHEDLCHKEGRLDHELDYTSENPINEAATRSAWEIVFDLIDRGVDPGRPTRYTNVSAQKMMLKMWGWKKDDTFRDKLHHYILAGKIDIHANCSEDGSLLSHAIQRNWWDIVHTLIEWGANPAIHSQGILHTAIQRRFIDEALYLVKQAPELIKQEDKPNYSLFDTVVYAKCSFFRQPSKNFAALLDVLLENGANPAHMNRDLADVVDILGQFPQYNEQNQRLIEQTSELSYIFVKFVDTANCANWDLYCWTIQHHFDKVAAHEKYLHCRLQRYIRTKQWHKVRVLLPHLPNFCVNPFEFGANGFLKDYLTSRETPPDLMPRLLCINPFENAFRQKIADIQTECRAQAEKGLHATNTGPTYARKVQAMDHYLTNELKPGDMDILKKDGDIAELFRHHGVDPEVPFDTGDYIAQIHS